LNEPINSYRDLRVWQGAMALAEACYLLTRGFPKDEMFGMTSQLRRAAASVPANIAEGHGRELTPSFIQFLRVAQGALKEVETHLLFSQRIGLATAEEVRSPMEQCEAVGKMLRALIRSLQQKAAD